MIPEGKYTAKATRAELGVSKNKGTEFFLVNFEIDGLSEPIAWYGYLSDGAADRTIESLRACGCTFPSGEICNLAGLGSKKVQLVIEHETYEGKTRAKVQWVNEISYGLSEDTKMGESQKRSLSARMKGRILGGSATRNGAPPPRAQQNTMDDSDIPF